MLAQIRKIPYRPPPSIKFEAKKLREKSVIKNRYFGRSVLNVCVGQSLELKNLGIDAFYIVLKTFDGFRKHIENEKNSIGAFKHQAVQ